MLRNFILKIRLLHVIAAVITCFSCASGSPHVIETGHTLKNVSITLKDGGHADVDFYKLMRSYWTGQGWFQGAGGQPSHEIKHFYCVVTGTIQPASGRAFKFGWIGPYFDLSYYYVKPSRLVLEGKDIFIEYILVPALESGRYLPIERTPFDGNPRLLVKYAKYDRTKQYKPTGGGIGLAFSSTYKWPVEYMWKDISKSEFEKAAKSGVLINLDFYKQNSDIGFDYYDYFLKRVAPDTEETRFLHAVKSGNAGTVVEMLILNPELINVFDYDGKTALHLALESQYRRHLLPLLYRFNPRINAVDFKGQTPLHTATRYSAGEAIKKDLIDKGGLILYASCKFAQLRNQYGLPDKVFSRSVAKNGWLGNDAYEVWIEWPVKNGRHYNQSSVLAEGKNKVVHELRLSGAPDSSIRRTIEWILDKSEEACITYRERGGHSPIQGSLIRIYGPNLRELVKEYNKAAGR